MFRKCYSMNNVKDSGRVMVGVGYFVRKCYLTYVWEDKRRGQPAETEVGASTIDPRSRGLGE